MVTVYYVNINSVQNCVYSLFYSIVSEERKRKTDRYRFFEDRKRSVCGEILLYYAILKNNKDDFKNKVFTYNKYGKPYIDSMFFNISHSGEWVIVACSDKEVGVDIEKIQMENGVELYFSEEEKKYIRNADKEKKANVFTKLWTLKESYLKYVGTGLYKDLDSFSINFSDDLIICCDKNGGEIELKSFLFHDNYYCSICSKDDEVRFENVKIRDLLFKIEVLRRR